MASRAAAPVGRASVGAEAAGGAAPSARMGLAPSSPAARRTASRRVMASSFLGGPAGPGPRGPTGTGPSGSDGNRTPPFHRPDRAPTRARALRPSWTWVQLHVDCSPMPGPVALPRAAQARASILEAARQLFAARGMHEVTMADVAEAAGVVRATVFNHFGTKHALVDAITAEVLQGYVLLLDGALADE